MHRDQRATSYTPASVRVLAGSIDGACIQQVMCIQGHGGGLDAVLCQIPFSYAALFTSLDAQAHTFPQGSMALYIALRCKRRLNHEGD